MTTHCFQLGVRKRFCGGWIEDIEEVRKQSNIQGAWSGKVKTRTKILKEVLKILVNRVEEADGEEYLRIKNSDLERELRAFEKEIHRLRDDLKKAHKSIKQLRST